MSLSVRAFPTAPRWAECSNRLRTNHRRNIRRRCSETPKSKSPVLSVGRLVFLMKIETSDFPFLSFCCTFLPNRCKTLSFLDNERKQKERKGKFHKTNLYADRYFLYPIALQITIFPQLRSRYFKSLIFSTRSGGGFFTTRIAASNSTAYNMHD